MQVNYVRETAKLTPQVAHVSQCKRLTQNFLEVTERL